jgi:hypothetical protein
MIEDLLFVTGGLRSGTTLLANLLGVLQQPFPLLFVEAKRAFLREAGVPRDNYPIGHLFHDGDPGADALDQFLRRWRTSPEELARLFGAMKSYSGQKTRFTDEELQQAFAAISTSDDFASVVAQLDRTLAHPPDGRVGSKEVFCEEFLPHLLGRGARCVVILRDPRDVLASLNHGRGREFGGELRPTLFNIRSWRKSVKFALELQSHPRFAWCRYEDLVADAAGVLGRIYDSLGLGELDRDRLERESWSSNSSYGERAGISDESVGAWRNVLPSAAARLVEAATLPELQLLGYETSMSIETAVSELANSSEPYAITRPGFERDALNAENIALEIARLRR